MALLLIRNKMFLMNWIVLCIAALPQSMEWHNENFILVEENNVVQSDDTTACIEFKKALVIRSH